MPLGARATALQDPPGLLAVGLAAAALSGADALPARGVRVPHDTAALGGQPRSPAPRSPRAAPAGPPRRALPATL